MKVKPTTEELWAIKALDNVTEALHEQVKQARQNQMSLQQEIAKSMCPFRIGDLVTRVTGNKRQYGKVVFLELEVLDGETLGFDEDRWLVNVGVELVKKNGEQRRGWMRERWPYFPVNGVDGNNVQTHE